MKHKMCYTAVLPAYLPDTKYFFYLLTSKYVLFADHLQYTKRSSITRSTNLANNIILTIPVQHNGLKRPICKKYISVNENWAGKHLKTIHHLYNKLPYFEEYFTEFSLFYTEKPVLLTDFLFKLTRFFLKKLKINTQLLSTSGLGFSKNLENSLINFAKKNNLTNYYFKQSEIKMFNRNILLKANIETTPLHYSETNSVMSMNILEYLFSYGPESAFLIRE